MDAHPAFCARMRAKTPDGMTIVPGTKFGWLNLSGDILNPPQDHVIYFIGDQPCEMDGSIMAGIVNESADDSPRAPDTIRPSLDRLPRDRRNLA